MKSKLWVIFLFVYWIFCVAMMIRMFVFDKYFLAAIWIICVHLAVWNILNWFQMRRRSKDRSAEALRITKMIDDVVYYRSLITELKQENERLREELGGYKG